MSRKKNRIAIRGTFVATVVYNRQEDEYTLEMNMTPLGNETPLMPAAMVITRTLAETLAKKHNITIVNRAADE